MASSSLSDRFRRAIESNDLTSAQRVYERAKAVGKPIDVRNQVIGPGDSAFNGVASARHKADSQSLHSHEALGDCLALSAAQFDIAVQIRIRERNRELSKPKSSLALAIEGDASIELIQWLLDMGHESGDFSRDVRGCTAVSLAAQHNRTDVVEACCIDAVAHAATMHHQRSLLFGYSHTLSRYPSEENGIEVDSDEDEEEDGDEEFLNPMGEALDESLEEPRKSMSQSPEGDRAPTPPAKRSTSPVRFQDSNYTGNVRVGSPDPAQEPKRDIDSPGGSSELDDIVGVTIQRLLDCPDELGRTALTLASMKGYEEVTRLLIDLGATIDLGDYEGNRPLHYAAAYNQLIIVQTLIERGCAYSAKNMLGFTAADYAFNTSLKSALEAFSRAQFDINRIKARVPVRSSADEIRRAIHGHSGGGGGHATDHQYDTSNSSITQRPGDSSTASSTTAGGATNNIGLFPGPIRSPDSSLPSSPQAKLSSTLRDLF